MEQISMEEIVMNISSKDIIINKDLGYMKNYECKDKNDNKKFKFAKRPTFDFSYSLFYVPKNVVEEYNNNSEIKLTKAVLKRKLSAMIYATMQTKEKLNNGLYLHKFNTYEIVANLKAKVVNSVVLREKTGINSGAYRLYQDLCKSYELDGDRIDFCCMKKYHIYGKDNMTPVNTQIRKHPNKLLWSDDNGKTWHSYVNGITTEGYSVVNGKPKYWIYRLK